MEAGYGQRVSVGTKNRGSRRVVWPGDANENAVGFGFCWRTVLATVGEISKTEKVTAICFGGDSSLQIFVPPIKLQTTAVKYLVVAMDRYLETRGSGRVMWRNALASKMTRRLKLLRDTVHVKYCTTLRIHVVIWNH